MAFSRTHSTAADGTFSAAGAAAWNANQTPSGADVGGIPYCPTATTETTSAGFTFNGSTLALAMGTITTAIGPQTWTETRNAVGVTFPGLKYTITDTASAAGSLAMQILGGASGTTDLFSVSKDGLISTSKNGAHAFYVNVSGQNPVGFGRNSSVGGMQIFTGTAATPSDTNSMVLFSGTTVARLDSAVVLSWSGSNITQASDAGLSRTAAGIVRVNNGTTGGGALELLEQTAPSGASNTARLFTQDNGAGKTQLMVIFGSGVAQQIAIEA